MNKQYSKDEYEKLAACIAEHMQKTGEWGEFFPPEFSPFGYNESLAQEYFPSTKEEVSRWGAGWKIFPEENTRSGPGIENCVDCGKAFETAYSADTAYTLYCEECYLAEVY